MPRKYVRKRRASAGQRYTLEDISEAVNRLEKATLVLQRYLDPEY